MRRAELAQRGTLESAGGIGGLLAVHDATVGSGPGGGGDSHVFTYDHLGNVGQVVDLDAASATAAVVAHYEYDSYGNVVTQSGPYADTNAFRFSSKYHDAETGLVYYGYRYYSPRLGRWLNRDPIGEWGGLNLYAFVRNSTTRHIDSLGLQGIPPLDELPLPGFGWSLPKYDPKPKRDRTKYPNLCPKGFTLWADQRATLPEEITDTHNYKSHLFFTLSWSVKLTAQPKWNFIGSTTIAAQTKTSWNPQLWISHKEPLVPIPPPFEYVNVPRPPIDKNYYLYKRPPDLHRTYFNKQSNDRRLRSIITLGPANPTCGKMYVALYQRIWDVEARLSTGHNLALTTPLDEVLVAGATWLDDATGLVYCLECSPKQGDKGQ